MNATRKLWKIVKASGIPISSICKKTGLSVKPIYSSFSENSKRPLTAYELMVICNLFNYEPMNLIENM